MASRDPAFLWETEVLRSSERPSKPEHRDDAGDWRTLREASETTGVPISTIRKWARNEKIPSFLEQTEDGDLRLVSMSGIKQRADELGRDLKADPVSDIPSSRPEPEVPEGTMLVPLDAWNRMLNQLGNLHEAGQQLAEAKERAARAETEATFLKERLAELRDELTTVRETASDLDPGVPGDTAPDDPPSSTSVIRGIYQSWRTGRRSRR